VGLNARFWGTRGSIPTSGATTQRYGGNTSCVEVTSGKTVLIFDAGTGLRELGIDLLAKSPEGVKAHLFLSHTHWDHIQGFPFFSPAYHVSSILSVYELAPKETRLKDALFFQMQPGYFPITPSSLKAEIATAYFENAKTTIVDTTVEYAEQSHPGRSFGYRITRGKNRVVYATDNELDTFLIDPELTVKRPEQLRSFPLAVENFSRDADLLIAEAQYTDEQYERRVGWGHARISTVVDLAVRASVKRLALFHHDPQHSDDEIDRLVDTARQRAKHHRCDLEIFAAQEGQSISV
jgi:phosphoribosyl 1,2-cyclic phosphodiesterase